MNTKEMDSTNEAAYLLIVLTYMLDPFGEPKKLVHTQVLYSTMTSFSEGHG